MKQQHTAWFNIDSRLFMYLALAFIGLTVIGTLSHELAHYLAARALGCEAHISYYATHYSGKNLSAQQSFIIRFCGPLQTILTGTIGFTALLYTLKPFHRSQALQTRHWALLFLALFWLRQVFNFLANLFELLKNGRYPRGNDEVQLAIYLQLPEVFIELPLALLGVVVMWVVFFKCVPFRQRITFAIAAAIGGLGGFYIWMYALGPVLLP